MMWPITRGRESSSRELRQLGRDVTHQLLRPRGLRVASTDLYTVLRVGHLFLPFDEPPVEVFLNGDVGHRLRRRRTMPRGRFAT